MSVPDAGTTPAIPPKQLRFMAESDEAFLPLCDTYAARIADFIGAAGPQYRLVDVGCGYGRLAYGLLRAGFRGRYFGFDVLGPHIAWLQQNFRAPGDPDRFAFEVVDLYNERYNATGKPLRDMQLPAAMGAPDCLCALSVFTHMYTDEIETYFARLLAALVPGGRFVATFFCLPDEADPFDSSAGYRLVKQLSPVSFIHSIEEPLLVIAYRRHFIDALFRRHGLRIVQELKGSWHSREGAQEFQDWFFLQRS